MLPLFLSLALATPQPAVEQLRPHHLAGCWTLSWGVCEPIRWAIVFEQRGSYRYLEHDSFSGFWRLESGNVLVLTEWYGDGPPERVAEYRIPLDVSAYRRGELHGTATTLEWDGQEWRPYRVPMRLERLRPWQGGTTAMSVSDYISGTTHCPECANIPRTLHATISTAVPVLPAWALLQDGDNRPVVLPAWLAREVRRVARAGAGLTSIPHRLSNAALVTDLADLIALTETGRDPRAEGPVPEGR